MGRGRLRAFQEHIVVRVGTGVHLLGGLYPKAVLPDGAQRGCDFAVTAISAGDDA
jgi:hypothetical protein